MSSVKYLREFVNERLTAAVEEIFGVFEKTIALYEEEIHRQRRLLEIVWKPEIKLHRMELPQQHVCEEEALSDQQHLCIQDRNSSLHQKDPDPPQIKEEEEELCTSQEVEQRVVKQETDDFILTPTHEESDHSEDQTLSQISGETQGAEEEKYLSFTPDESSVAPESNGDQLLLHHSFNEADSQDQNEDNHEGSRSTRAAETRCLRSRGHTTMLNCVVNNSNMSDIYCNTQSGKKLFLCDTCGKEFAFNSHYQRHRRVHTGERPFLCRTCGKVYARRDILLVHMRTHSKKK